MTQVDLGLAFLAGLGGSLHCLGMCSGFALAVARGAGRRSLLRQTLYSSGRLSSYVFLGLLAGTLGQSLGVLVPLKTAQISLATVAGVALVVVGLRMLGFRLPIPDRFASRRARLRWPVGGPRFLVGALRTLMPPAGLSQAFYLGLMNGMLPCPLVYALLPAAFATGSGAGGGLLMLALGAGTLPMMLGVGIAGRALIPRVEGLARLPGLVVLIFGCVTLSRALLFWGAWPHALSHSVMH